MPRECFNQGESVRRILDCTSSQPNFSPVAPTDCSIRVFDIIGTRTRRVLLSAEWDKALTGTCWNPACVECQPARCLARAKEYLRPVSRVVRDGASSRMKVKQIYIYILYIYIYYIYRWYSLIDLGWPRLSSTSCENKPMEPLYNLPRLSRSPHFSTGQHFPNHTQRYSYKNN